MPTGLNQERLPAPSFVESTVGCTLGGGKEVVTLLIFDDISRTIDLKKIPLPTVNIEAGVVSPMPTLPVPFGFNKMLPVVS